MDTAQAPAAVRPAVNAEESFLPPAGITPPLSRLSGVCGRSADTSGISSERTVYRTQVGYASRCNDAAIENRTAREAATKR
jgi:hypothetical protein